jgi:hypothetical protein
MSTVAKDHSRADRLREYAAEVEVARHAVAALGAVVRGREAREWTADEPAEVGFAATEVDGRALPAAVWVALRRDDVDAAVEAMAAASRTPFLVAAHEELGEGYRLQTVEETRPLPETYLLLAQLATMLDIPVDVLAMVAEWGPGDPRGQSEIDQLLDRRFGPPLAATAAAPAEPAASAPPRPSDAGLTMSVAEAADVLQLSDAQRKVLATLVRRVGVRITA